MFNAQQEPGSHIPPKLTPPWTTFVVLLAVVGCFSLTFGMHEGVVYPTTVAPGSNDYHRVMAYKQFNPLTELPTWMEAPLPLVHMSMENSVHFGINAVTEWDNGTLPGSKNDGVFWLRVSDMKVTEKREFTNSMFHQIRCLNIIRTSVVEFRSNDIRPSVLTRHCMNYIRQMVLCRSDITMESGRDPVGPQAVVSDITHVCRDWRVVWEDIERRTAG